MLEWQTSHLVWQFEAGLRWTTWTSAAHVNTIHWQVYILNNFYSLIRALALLNYVNLFSSLFKCNELTSEALPFHSRPSWLFYLDLHPILDTRISVRPSVRLSVRLVLPPLKSEMSCTGELFFFSCNFFSSSKHFFKVIFCETTDIFVSNLDLGIVPPALVHVRPASISQCTL